MHLYSSTWLALRTCSFGVGAAMATPIEGQPQTVQGGLFTHEKKDDLNQRINARITQSW
jgi:hypothetical protein